MKKRRSLGAWLWSAISMAAVLVIVTTSPGCGGGGGNNAGGGGGGGGGAGPLPGNTGVLPPATLISLQRTQDLPGMNVEIVGVAGGSGPGGAFQVGDYPSVTFTIKNNAGQDIAISELNSASIYLSGPTHNYMQVLERKTDLRNFSIDNGDGTYTYNWQLPIPATYVPSFNDSPTYGPAEGDWAGEPIVDGTYTFGIEGYKNYDVEGSSVRDPFFGAMDVLFGNATMIQPRDVVTTENCNSCHVELRFHGGFRREVLQCLLCHTAGAEDNNNPALGNGTPGVLIDFGPMIHRIHMGARLPSNLGISTNTNGSRNYAATPITNGLYRGSTFYDYSKIVFPVWPSLDNPMPRDAGYSALSSTEQALENAQRQGVVACHKCHGDPDGAGPLPAPAQGDNAYSHATRVDCGSCHDDWVWDRPYSANMTSMPPQTNDDSCTFCHPADGGALPSRELHKHPLTNDAVHQDFRFVVTAITEAGMNNGSGTFEAGEKMQVSFQLKTLTGNNDVPLGNLNRVEFAVAGPVNNRHILHTAQVPTGSFASLGAGPTYTMNLPFAYEQRYLGDSNGAMLDSFTIPQGAPWPGTTPVVYARTATAAGTTLAANVPAFQNYIDVGSSVGFVRNGYLVIDDGTASEEYFQIQFVDGNRIWFTSPYSGGYKIETEFAHFAGASVLPVTLTTLTAGMQYSITGNTVNELMELGAGVAVVADYTADWVIPAMYPTPLNGSPDFTEMRGKWTGKTLVPGTYTFGIWGREAFSVTAYGETTSYQGTTNATNTDFQVGVGSPVTSYDLISGAEDCNACHDTMYFHGGGRRGFDSCIMCHGTTAAEDRPRYVAANAPATTRVAVEFREMLHKIHMGEELDNPTAWEVIGFGNGYPNNFSVHTYEEVVFPAFNGGAKQCTACHGSSDSWETPGNRSHPTEQGMPSLDWTDSCGSCHNSATTAAHMATQMSGSVEACSVCHGTGRAEAVELIHKEF